MPSVLAIETSSHVGSVCLLRDGKSFSEFARDDVKLSAWLLPAIDRVLHAAGLEKSQVDAVAFGNGPGSFTGVRTACATAQALAYALHKPLFSIDSMLAFATQAIKTLTAHVDLAQSNGGERVIEVILDARMNELYRQNFSFAIPNKLLGNEWQARISALAPPQLVRAENHDTPLGIAVGSGASLLLARGMSSSLSATVVTQVTEHVETHWANAIAKIAMARLHEGGHTIAPVDALPNYVRNNVAKTEVERAHEAKSRAATPRSIA